MSRIDKPDEATAYSVRRLVTNVGAVLDAYRLERVDLVGYSWDRWWGGMPLRPCRTASTGRSSVG